MLETSKTIEFFKEISKIPRESGNEKGIAEYLCDFAKKRNLFYLCDKYHNVLVKKKTSDKRPLILQAHIDMVCEKEENLKFDFLKDAIQVIEKDGYLTANGTTLGADNGIGVAQILTILDSDLPCNIEAVFTVSEETSMIGAMNFDAGLLQGKHMLNLDGFEENTIIIESACFYDIILKSKFHFHKSNKKHAFRIVLTGLLGGHSGFDIDKNRGNASILLANLLEQIENICIVNFIGGTKFNVIPSTARCEFYTDVSKEVVKAICDNFVEEMRKQYASLKIELEDIISDEKAIDEASSKKFLSSIINFKHGVIFYNDESKPTTSINLGVVDLKEKIMKVGMRSSRVREEEKCLELIKSYCHKNDLEMEIIGHQPGFESAKDSELITTLLKSHPKELYKEIPSLKSMHVTVEVGFFKEKIQDLEIAIISPEIIGAHTVEERVKIDSITTVNKWLDNFIREFE